MKKVEKLNIPLQPSLDIAGVKCRFFVQYWGVKCMYVGGVGLVEIGTGGWNLKHPDFFLELKPLSKLSDEDAVSYIDYCETFEDDLFYDRNKVESKIELAKWRVEQCFKNLSLYDFDYLRSKGYAIPFMDLSIEKLIELGWMRLS